MAVTPAQHLLAWFTPARRQLLNGSALDRLARRTVGSFSRFLSGAQSTTFERVDLRPYYSALQLVGYLPPGDVWVPERALTVQETSADIREWFTETRRQLINFKKLDELSGRPLGVFGRWLSNEPHLTFKIIGIDVYYPALQLLGFEPPAMNMDNNITKSFSTSIEHLLTWFTPERRQFTNSLGLDVAAGQPEGTLSQLLAGYPAGQRQLGPAGLASYYPSLAVLGYHPDLDLAADESVQRFQALEADQ